VARRWGITVPDKVTVVPTIHPSAVLRADDRDTAYAGLVTDLRLPPPRWRTSVDKA
jgi:uracil-DNA glycosylase